MYYFAYGSNLSKKQMLERCPDSKPGFVASLPNYKLVFVGWSRKWHGGVASIRPFRDKKVVGGVYEISKRDLRLLDEDEGYTALYDRLNVLVITEDDDPQEAITYEAVAASIIFCSVASSLGCHSTPCFKWA